MTDDKLSPELPPTEAWWQEIDQTLDEIARLARSGRSVREFHGELLAQLVRSLAALGGAIWTTDATGGLKLTYQLQLEDTLLTVDAAGREHHARLLANVLRTGQACFVTPYSGDDQTRNPTSLLLLLSPIMTGGEAVGIVEIFQRPDSRSELLPGYLRVLVAACELASDYYRERELLDVTSREKFSRGLREFYEGVHASLDLEVTSTVIANEGRRLIDCDRVSVVVRRRGRYRLMATSGIDTFQRRANVVRRLESLVELTAVGQEPLWHPRDSAELAPQIQTALDAYLDESHAQLVAVVPLRVPSREAEAASNEATSPCAMLVVERFTNVTDDGLPGRVAAVCAPAALALRNALEVADTPLLPLLRTVRRAGWYARWERLPRTLTAAAALLAVALVLTFVPADLRIEARGELQPQRRYHVFAPSDGVVSSLAEGPDKSVQEGDVLVVLTNLKLDLEMTEVLGKKRTTEERLAAVRAARFHNDPAAVNARDRIDLTAQEEQLKEQLAGLERQVEILNQQQQRLEVRSPTRGQVLTWEIERSLAARPVQRGEKLLTAADLDGPWELELSIDDDQVGHVLQALHTLGPPLSVSYVVATDPGVEYEGRLRELATAAEVDDTGRVNVRALVDISASSVPQRQPGATVTARIFCGRRACGYVLFRPLIEAVQTWWPF